MLLGYDSTNLNVILCYLVVQMIVHINYDMAYLVITEACSFYAKHFYPSDWTQEKSHKPTPRQYAPILKMCKTIRNIATSTAKSETTGTFNKSIEGVGI